MAQLFVYGTLINPDVQKEALGRTFKLKSDVLHNFTTESIAFDDGDYVIATPLKGATTPGKVMTISDSDLVLLDRYETNAYERIKVELQSGIQAWVYVKPSST